MPRSLGPAPAVQEPFGRVLVSPSKMPPSPPESPSTTTRPGTALRSPLSAKLKAARPTHYTPKGGAGSGGKGQPANKELLPLLRYMDCDVCGGADEGESFLQCVHCHNRVHPQCLTTAPADDYTYLVTTILRE